MSRWRKGKKRSIGSKSNDPGRHGVSAALTMGRAGCPRCSLAARRIEENCADRAFTFSEEVLCVLVSNSAKKKPQKLSSRKDAVHRCRRLNVHQLSHRSEIRRGHDGSECRTMQGTLILSSRACHAEGKYLVQDLALDHGSLIAVKGAVAALDFAKIAGCRIFQNPSVVLSLVWVAWVDYSDPNEKGASGAPFAFEGE